MRERAFRWTTNVLLVVALGGSAFLGHRQSGLVHDGAEAHLALCSFRADLERRVNVSKQFLADNPNGIPGIDADVIRTSIRNQQQTIDSVAFLNCPSELP